jgi:ribonuclease P protein component
MPPLSRLKKRPDFLAVRKAGNKAVAKGMVCQLRHRGDGDTTCRVGFTVSKKAGKTAVQRNRIKRRLRAVVDDIASSWDNLSGTDLVVIGRRSAEPRDFEKLKSDLKYCLHQLCDD